MHIVPSSYELFKISMFLKSSDEFNYKLKYFPRGLFSEGVMINFISKSSAFVQLIICKKIAGVICLNEIRRKISTPKVPVAERFVLLDYRFQFNIKILSDGL